MSHFLRPLTGELIIALFNVDVLTLYNRLWNFVIGFITPYMVDSDQGNLRTKVFFIWGATCTACAIFAYLLVSETKGLSLEQVDRMLEETTPRTSAKWTPHSRFANLTDINSLGSAEKNSLHAPTNEHREDLAA